MTLEAWLNSERSPGLFRFTFSQSNAVFISFVALLQAAEHSLMAPWSRLLQLEVEYRWCRSCGLVGARAGGVRWVKRIIVKARLPSSRVLLVVSVLVSSVVWHGNDVTVYLLDRDEAYADDRHQRCASFSPAVQWAHS